MSHITKHISNQSMPKSKPKLYNHNSIKLEGKNCVTEMFLSFSFLLIEKGYKNNITLTTEVNPFISSDQIHMTHLSQSQTIVFLSQTITFQNISVIKILNFYLII